VPSPGAIARRVLDTIAQLEAGGLEAKDAAVLGQLFNVLRGLAKLEHDMMEVKDLRDRLADLEEFYRDRGGARGYRR
jgi:hypothetical protein